MLLSKAASDALADPIPRPMTWSRTRSAGWGLGFCAGYRAVPAKTAQNERYLMKAWSGELGAPSSLASPSRPAKLLRLRSLHAEPNHRRIRPRRAGAGR